MAHPVRKKNVMEYIESTEGRLQIVFLPPYSSDLNPDELVWIQMRHLSTSKKPLKKVESLMNRTIIDLEKTKHNKKLVKSFFKEKTVLFSAT